MSKLAHSSDEHMEQIERDGYQRDGLSLAMAAAGSGLQQADPDLVRRIFAAEVMGMVSKLIPPAP